MGSLTKNDYEMKINIQNQFFKFIIHFSRPDQFQLQWRSDDSALQRIEKT